MLKLETEKLNNIKQDMVNLGTETLKTNELILSALEKKEVSELLTIQELSKPEWYAKVDHIDTQIINVFALHTPEAKDLRQLVAFLKITNEFDRIANSCNSFIHDFPTLFSHDIDKEFLLAQTIPLQRTCVIAVKNTVELLHTEDHQRVEKLYQEIIIEENKNDLLYNTIEHSLFDKMNSDIRLFKEYQGMMSAIRRLEKVADRALSIAFLMHYAHIGGKIHDIHPSK